MGLRIGNVDIVPLYQDKRDKVECLNYQGVSSSSVPGKLYKRKVIERSGSMHRASESGGTVWFQGW